MKSKAPTTLRGKRFGVNDQFPKEIETKRKVLYGVMKKAKRDPNNKVRLVRDKFFINNVQYIPENSENRDQFNESNQTSGNARGEQTYRKQGYKAERFNRSRIIYPRHGPRVDKQRNDKQVSSMPGSYRIPVTNRFLHLTPDDSASTSTSYTTPTRA